MNRNLLAIPPHPSKKISDQVKDDPSIVNLTVGEPEYGPPRAWNKEIVRLLQESDAATIHRYASSRGVADLRDAIAKRYAEWYRLSLDADSQVLVTNGAAEALWLSIFALTNEGDEIIIPDPSYMLYEPIATSLNRKPIRVPTYPDEDFLPNLKRIEESITLRTRLLILNSPANPTGVVYPKTLLRSIVELAKSRQLYVVHDEVFDRCTYVGKHVPIHVLFPRGRTARCGK